MNTIKAYEEVVDFIAAGTTPQNVIDFRPSEAAHARIHVVCSPKDEYLAIITAYLPDKVKWSDDFRVRIAL